MTRHTRLLAFCAATLGFALFSARSQAAAQTATLPLVHIAEIEVDPAQVETYKAALVEEIAASIKLEPGVLTLYAVSVKDHPTQIRLFETYADSAAYKSHLESPHFKKYKAATQGMVKSLKVVETDPILLGAKGK